MLKSVKTDMICCVIVVSFRKRRFIEFFCRAIVEKEAVWWAVQICSKVMFLVFEMSLEVEAIIVPRDSQYVVVRNFVTENRWILIVQITEEAAAGLEFPSYKWPQELFYAIDLILEYEFF